MKPVSALWPLARRPALVLPVLYLLFVLTITGVFNQSLGIKSSLSLSETRDFLWINSVLSMGGLAGLLSLFARAADMKLFAFAVPSLRVRVLTEKFIVGFVIALVLPLSLILTGDSRNAPAILGCAVLSFATVSAMADASVPSRLKGPVSIALLIAVYKSDLIRVGFESAPMLTGVVAILISVLLVRRELSTEAGRLRAVFQPPMGNTGTGTVFAARDTDVQTTFTSGSAGSATVFDWLRRTDFENFGARRFGWPRYVAQSAATSCVFAYILDNSGFAAMMGLMYLTMQGHRLRGSSVYPLSRATRAKLNFAAGAADSAAYFLTAAFGMWLLNKSGLPQPLSDGADTDKLAFLPMIPATMIWAPLVQLLSATSTMPIQKQLRSTMHALRYLLVALFAFALAMFTATSGIRLAAATSPAITVTLGILLALLVQTAYWLALRRHFSQGDLV
jgi:hypothetical protein